MKLFKIFKKKSPTSASNGQASNLVCNIHWAEVQRELGHDVIKEKRNIVNYNTNHVPAYKSSGWNSCDEENYSSGGNSWSSVSLSSSNKTTSAEQFQEENFSRASSPGTEPIKSCMIDDISLVDVEQFEERRLAKVRRKVSRVDSLKKFLFSSKLEEKKSKLAEHVPYYPRPLVANVEPSYKASCLEVHDRWLGVHHVQNCVKEEEEEDNVSCMVNINMDMRAPSELDSRLDMDIRSPDDSIRSPVHGIRSPVDSSSSVMMNNNTPSVDQKSRFYQRAEKIDSHDKTVHEIGLRRTARESSDEEKICNQGRVDNVLRPKKLSRSVSQPSHNVRMKVLHNNSRPSQPSPTQSKQQYMRMTVFKPSDENLGVIITSSSKTNGFIIAHIDPGSVIDRDGRFRPGDKLIRINGHNLLDLTINQVREILKCSGNQVEIDVLRDEGKKPSGGAKLSKSESLRIFRALPASHDSSKTGSKSVAKSNVVTERIITPMGNLTKTIITIPDNTQPTWNMVDIDIDTGDNIHEEEGHLDNESNEEDQVSDVSVHYVHLQGPDHGLLLDTYEDGGVFVEDIDPHGKEDTSPGLEIGDEILSVNGVILKGLSLEQVYDVLEDNQKLLCCVARKLIK